METSDIKNRIFKLVKLLLLLFALAVVLLFLNSFGIRIPCMFRAITRLKCPGCGTTRMSLALLHGDIRAAIYYNKVVPFLIPPFSIIFVRQCCNFVFRGKISFSKLEHYFFVVSIVVLLIYMVLRNL